MTKIKQLADVRLTKFRQKLPRYRTIEISKFGQIPSDSCLAVVNLKPDVVYDRLLYIVFWSICFMFLFNSLDTVSNSPAIRSMIISSINWGTLYVPFFPNRLWAPITCEWYHGSWEHLIGNMVGFAIVAAWLAAAFDAKTWRVFFFVFGPIAGIAFVFMYHSPAADFTNWHGPLCAITSEPNTPLAGASGGVFAMLGACLAAALRYQRAGIPSWMRVGVFELLSLPILQFVLVDWGNSGIAGAAHLIAFALGFAFGFVPRLKGKVSLLTSNLDAIGIDSVTVDDRNKSVVGAVIYLRSGFDQAKDFVVKRQEFLGHNVQPAYTLVSGSRPAVGTGCRQVPLNIVPVRTPVELYRKVSRSVWFSSMWTLLAISGLSQMFFGHYGSSQFPSIFVGTMVFGIVFTFRINRDFKTRLGYEPPVKSASQSNAPEIILPSNPEEGATEFIKQAVGD